MFSGLATAERHLFKKYKHVFFILLATAYPPIEVAAFEILPQGCEWQAFGQALYGHDVWGCAMCNVNHSS